MFQFSADQRHALQHGVQDLGKLTLAVLFLGSAMGALPLRAFQPTTKALTHQASPMRSGHQNPASPASGFRL